MRLGSINEVKAYFEGKIDGITLYAWWKNGVQYVGSCGNTLKCAKEELLQERDAALKAFSEGKEIFCH